MAKAQKTALAVFKGALVALTEHMRDHFSTEHDRQLFADKVVEDLENPDYRLYTLSYCPSEDF